MDFENISLPVKSVIELPALFPLKPEHEETNNDFDILGRVMDGNKYCWIASGAVIFVVNLQTGHKCAAWKFGNFLKNQDTCITSVCEIALPVNVGSTLIAVGLQHGTTDGSISLFSMQGSRVLCSIKIGEPVSHISLIDPGGNLGGPLSALDGILAVATANGNILLLDICRQICIDALIHGPEFGFDENHSRTCIKIIPKIEADYAPLKEMAQAKGEHLAFNIDAMSLLGPVTNLSMITPLSALVVGSATGAFAIIDLLEFRLVYKSKPILGPVQQLIFQEPSDDPRAHCFLWVIHSSNVGTIANLHQLVYRKKESVYTLNNYKDFVSCHCPFSLTLSNEESKIISCQVMHKALLDESSISLCMFSWSNNIESTMCIFDVNQWYKMGMPSQASLRAENNFFVVFPITLDVSPQNYIDLKMIVSTIAPFKTLQRYDEYYYPGSLSFDCDVLTPTKNFRLHWPGLQVNTLRKIKNAGSAGLINPTPLYLECLSIHLMPVFHESTYTCESPVSQQRDMLLSLSLDRGDVGYLQCCAMSWANGSHAGPADTGPTLRTMLDWIWKQSIRVKNTVNAFSVQLFDNSGIPLSAASQKLLLHGISQYQILLKLVEKISKSCKDYISPTVNLELQSQKNALKTIKEYFEVMEFLLNVGLLPENTNGETTCSSNDKFVPYPAGFLKRIYDQRRKEINAVSNNTVDWGCELLFIDSLIEYECGGNNIRSIWLSDCGTSVYPPDSIQALLWVYLQTEVSTTYKHMLFIYFFLDLASILDEEKYSMAVNHLMKFASIFGVHISIIKNTEAFWHLDQKEFKSALELLSLPQAPAHGLARWQRQLLVRAPAAQGAPREALQAMRALPGSLVEPELRVAVLLDNGLLCEAFECQRAWGGGQLLVAFFEGCVKYGTINSIMGLSLNKQEEQELITFLQNSDSIEADNLRVLYYLQRSRFIEAISVNRNLRHHNTSRLQRSPTSNVSTRDMIVKAFQNTLPDVMNKLTNYCDQDKQIFDKIRYVDKPTPLSVSVVKMSTADPKTKSSLLLASFEKSGETQLNRGVKRVLGVEDVPFLRTPKSILNDRNDQSMLVYPKMIDSEQNHVNGHAQTETPTKRQRLDTPKRRQSISKNKGLHYSLHRLNSTPYNFDNLVSQTLERPPEKTVEDNFTLSTLSSPSTGSPNTNLSLLSTPLIKRKSNIMNKTLDVNSPVCARQSILKIRNKDSDQKFPKRVSNVSIVTGETPTRSIHFADNASTASELSDLEMEKSSRETSAESSKPTILGVQTRRSLRYSNTSVEKTKIVTTTTTNSTSTGDEVYYSLSSSATNDRDQTGINKDDKSDEITKHDVHFEDSNDSVQSDKPLSEASSDRDFELKCQEIAVFGPRPRRSVRHSKGNDSLHKLKQVSVPSPISKAKAKTNDKLTQKLLDLASDQKKSLRLVFESNAIKAKESSIRKSKPLARESIHAKCKDTKRHSGGSSRDTSCEKSEPDEEQGLSSNSKPESVEGTSDNEIGDFETKELVSQDYNQMCKTPDNQRRAGDAGDANKIDAVYNDEYGEKESQDIDIYADLMSNIDESLRQKSQANTDFYEQDVEPMETCPELFLSDEKSREKSDILNKKTEYELVVKDICITTTSTLEELNKSISEKSEEVLEDALVDHEETEVKQIEQKQLPNREEEINELKVQDQEEDKKQNDEIDAEENEDSDAILINSSEDDASSEGHNVGVIDIKDSTENSTGGTEDSEYSEEQECNEDAYEFNVKSHERNICISEEEIEVECEIVEDEQMDEEIENVRENSRESSVQVEEQYTNENTSTSGNSRDCESAQNDNNNISEANIEVIDDDESIVLENSINNEAMILNESDISEETVAKEAVDQFTIYTLNKTDKMNVAQVNLTEVNTAERTLIENRTINVHNIAIVESRIIEKENENTKKTHETNEIVIEALIEKAGELEAQEDADSSKIDYANITDDLSLAEEPEDALSNTEKNKTIQNASKLNTEAELKDSTIESDQSYMDAEPDPFDKTYKTEISTIGEPDILEINLSAPPTSTWNSEAANKTANIDVLDKTIVDIGEQDPSDVYDSATDKDLVTTEADKSSQSGKPNTVVSSKKENHEPGEVATPKRKERRRSTRLSKIDEDEVFDDKSEDLDNCSVASGTSMRSTRSRTRMLSTPVKSVSTPAEGTPRRSVRLRSTETSPASDIDASAKRVRRSTRKSSLDASPSVSSPHVAGTPSKRGRRKSLLATLSEPVIVEEKTEVETQDKAKDYTQQMEDYSKERRLTRQQRTMLMRSLGASEQSSSPVSQIKTPRKRRTSRSTEHSESGDEGGADSQAAASPGESVSSSGTCESGARSAARRGAFLKAAQNMAPAAAAAVGKRTRRNSAQSKDGYESDNSVASTKSSKICYKFSEPTDLNSPVKGDLLLVDASAHQEFNFSPPKHLFNVLPCIEEERSLSPVVQGIDLVSKNLSKEQCESGTKSVRRGRSRKNSTSSNKSTSVTNLQTRSSSRNSTK